MELRAKTDTGKVNWVGVSRTLSTDIPMLRLLNQAPDMSLLYQSNTFNI